MKVRELREFSQEELHEQLRQSREKLFSLRVQRSTGQADDYTQVGKVRKDIARIKTILRASELAQQKEK